MAYTKTTWVNNQAPAINADNLNKIEDGIYNSVRYADAQRLTDAQKTQARGNINAAPAGYGYGEVQSIAFWDDEDGTKLEQGLDSKFAAVSMRSKVFRSSFVDYPIFPESGNGGFADIFADGSNDSNGYPKAITIVYYARNVGVAGTTMATKQKIDGTWHPWEYVNPQMLLGKEYRTTERYLGRPVYKKLLLFTGAMTEGYSDMEHNIENIAAVAGCYTELFTGGTSWSTPILEGPAQIIFSATPNAVRKFSAGNFSEYSARVLMSYTKTTD